jgi:hypothetical protein
MLLFPRQTGCLKSEAQAHLKVIKSRECFVQVYIDNQYLIIILYILSHLWAVKSEEWL